MQRLFPSIPESIIAFAWEPNDSKFAVLHGESPRISVSFYHVKNNGKIELLSELAEKRTAALCVMLTQLLGTLWYLWGTSTDSRTFSFWYRDV